MPSKMGRPALPRKRVHKHMNVRFRTEGGMGLHKMLAIAAINNNRSLNSEIEHRLLKSFEDVELKEIVRDAVAEAMAERQNQTLDGEPAMRNMDGSLVKISDVNKMMQRNPMMTGCFTPTKYKGL